MSEKRKNPRVDVSFPVECKALPSHAYFYTVTKDISLGGVRILCNEFLAKNNPLRLTLNCINKVFDLTAKVVWCNQERASDRYTAGLQFVGMDAGDSQELAGFLKVMYNS
jgi:c-di-GMP-binding flagellar brake protein YcgR